MYIEKYVSLDIRYFSISFVNSIYMDNSICNTLLYSVNKKIVQLS